MPFPLHGGIGKYEGHGVLGCHADEVLLENIGAIDLQRAAEALCSGGKGGAQTVVSGTAGNLKALAVIAHRRAARTKDNRALLGGAVLREQMPKRGLARGCAVDRLGLDVSVWLGRRVDR